MAVTVRTQIHGWSVSDPVEQEDSYILERKSRYAREDAGYRLKMHLLGASLAILVVLFFINL